MNPRSLVALLLLLTCIACVAEPTQSPPARPDLSLANALAPNLTTLTGGDVLLTALQETEAGHRFIATPVGVEEGLAPSLPGQQTAPVVIAEGAAFFANWADVPGLVQAGDGTLIAHWLQQAGPEIYDYGVQVARSEDGGATWTRLGWLHDDAWETEDGEAIPGEHGFVSWIPEGSGARAFWLDGRDAGGHGESPGAPVGTMQLRTTTVVDGEIAPSEILDDRVCDCCPTAAIATPNGPLVAFRDRSEDEIRDVHILRRTPDGWQRTVIDTSGWRIPGCPVNGPALATQGDRVLVAWYTAHPEPQVYAAWSVDAGETFSVPILVASQNLGRLTAAVLEDAGYLVWLEGAEGAAGEENPPAEVRMVRVTQEGDLGTPLVVATTVATRRAGMPQLAVEDGNLGLAWTEVPSGGEEGIGTRVSYRRFETPE